MSLLKNLWRRDKRDSLFRGHDSLFKSVLASARVYGEYGCGESTVWVAANTCASILSVDTSQVWCESVLERVHADADNRDISIQHIDFGDVGAWGRPVSFKHRARFHLYRESIWNMPAKPDVVLIDGRFRVACFLTSLVSADPGTSILFDDFLDRPGYELVLDYIRPVESCGTQSLFVVPEGKILNTDTIFAEIERFQYVMD